MLNEYELVLTKGKLSLKVQRRHNVSISCIDEALKFLIKKYGLCNAATEKAFVLSYDSEGNIIGFMQIGTGTDKKVTIPFNTAFKFLLLNNAYGCIFIHNHIKGTGLYPSDGDHVFHAKTLMLCEDLEIELYANIILQNYDSYYDMVKNNLEVLE